MKLTPTLAIVLAAPLFCATCIAQSLEIGSDAIEKQLAEFESSESRSNLLNNERYHSVLLQWDLLRRLEANWLTTLQNSDEGTAFLQRLLSDEETLEVLLASGPVPDASRVVGLLQKIWAMHPDTGSDPVLRKTAAAFALEGVRRNYSEPDALARADFFLSSWKEGLLHAEFGKISDNQRRFIAHGTQRVDLNKLESLIYLRDNFHVPAHEYDGICWKHVTYRGNSVMGDSIHTPWFYEPFEGSYGSTAELFHRQGGVCGTLSNFGAAAAIANGVPAMSMGEPGHSSYNVLVDGEWRPSYTLTWKRGLHCRFFDGDSWQFLVATDACYRDVAAARKAESICRFARRIRQTAGPEQAVKYYATATREHPLYIPAWIEMGELMAAEKFSPGAWQSYLEQFAGAVAPLYPEVVMNYAGRFIDSRLDDICKSDEQKVHLMLGVHKAMTGYGKGRWDFSGYANRQKGHLPEGKLRDEFVFRVATSHLESNVSGEALQFGISHFKTRPPEVFSRFAKGITKKTSRAQDGTVDLESINRMISLAAADAGDLELFAEIGRSASRTYDSPQEVANVKRMQGKRLSDNGSLKLSSSSAKFDNPLQHWGVINPKGGWCHTHEGGGPGYAEVTLGRIGTVTGVSIVNRPGFLERIGHFKILVSMDRQNWTEVFDNGGETKAVYQIKLGENATRAKWVKLQQQTGGPLHIHQFLIYGKPES